MTINVLCYGSFFIGLAIVLVIIIILILNLSKKTFIIEFKACIMMEYLSALIDSKCPG